MYLKKPWQLHSCPRTMKCLLLTATIRWWDKKEQVTPHPTIYQLKNLKSGKRKILIKTTIPTFSNQISGPRTWVSPRWSRCKTNPTPNKCSQWGEFRCKELQMVVITRTNIWWPRWTRCPTWNTTNKLPSSALCNRILSNHLKATQIWEVSMEEVQLTTSINSTEIVERKILEWKLTFLKPGLFDF